MSQLSSTSHISQTPSPLGRVQCRDGVTLSCTAYGEGPTIVLVAGWSLPAAMWSYQVTALTQRGFRCVVFERRGHGRSDDNGSGYDYDTLALDIDSVLCAFDVREATLVGYSFGSGECVRYLSRRGGERVSRLLLLAPSTPFLARTDDNPGGMEQALFDQIRETMTRDFPAWIDESEEGFVVPSTSRGMRGWIKSMMLQSSLPALLACNRIMTSTDFRPELRALQLPIAIIQGDRDASLPVPLTGQPTAALLPGARLKVYEGAPHGLFVTHKDRLNQDIETFARDLPLNNTSEAVVEVL